MRFTHRSGTAPAGNSLRIFLLGLLLFLYGTIVVEGSSSPATTTTAPSSQQNQQLLVNVTGILANVLCWRSRWALDGADMWYAPWNHTVRCTLLPICLPEGFAILQDSLFQQQGGSGNSAANSYTTPKTSPLLDLSVEQVKAFSPDAGHKFNDTWYLSAEGNTKAEAFLRTLPTVRNNVLVEVEGYVSHLGATSGLLDAIQFRDLSPKTNGAAAAAAATPSSSTASTTTAAASVASAVSISGAGAGSEFIGSSTNSGSAGFQLIIPIVILLISALCASVTLA